MPPIQTTSPSGRNAAGAAPPKGWSAAAPKRAVRPSWNADGIVAPWQLAAPLSPVGAARLAGQQETGDYQSVVDGHRVGDHQPPPSIEGGNGLGQVMLDLAHPPLYLCGLFGHGFKQPRQFQATGEHEHAIPALPFDNWY